MNYEQITIFSLLIIVFAMLLWGKWRYDLIAFSALIAAVVFGVVPKDEAFTGFGHPATIIIALVLIVSKGLSNSGAVELITKYLVNTGRSLAAHIGIISSIAAGLSAIMNNVGALALLMPVDLQAAQKAKRSPALSLMPLSFASILGGLITLIGTPPNIIIASYRENVSYKGEELGSYAMFDFAPVGILCAIVGVLFITLIGWRLIPIERTQRNTSQELEDLEGYIAEAKVSEKSEIIGKKIKELDDIAEDHDVVILGLVRRGKRLRGFARNEIIKKGDCLVLEAGPEAIEQFVGGIGLEYIGLENNKSLIRGESLSFVEVVVPEGARIEGRSAISMRLINRYGVTLLGVSRQGKRFREQVRKLEIEAGDILLFLGNEEQINEAVNQIGCLPLAERGISIIQRQKALLSAGIFAGAILLASFGVLYLPIALACAAILMVIFKIINLRDIYNNIELPVIVLLGSMIPIGIAFEKSGGTSLIAEGIVSISDGYSPVIALTILMIVTMTLSDVLNNTATAVIAAPIAVELSVKLGVGPDPFLMAVAVSASCAFLTPIGHKNNTLIMGPGGYKFSDYWRMGLPLEILIIAISIPMIIITWPF